MRFRPTAVALGVVTALLVAATPPDGHVYEQTSTQVYNAIGCERAEDGATCETTTYRLSTAPGESSVGSTFTATPIGYALYHVDGDYSYDRYTPGTGIRNVEFVLDASRDLTGQVTLRGYQGAHASADTGVSVKVAFRYVDDAGTARTTTLSAEVEKPAMTPVDNVYEYAIDLPESLDGRTVTLSFMELGQRGLHVLTSGFTDGQGGSSFVLPTLEAVPAP